MKPNQDNNSKPKATNLPSGDESFVRQQLELLGQPEPIDPQFLERLSGQLDKAFATSMAGVDIVSETEVDRDELSTRRPSKETEQELTSGRPSGRRLPRWLGGIVAATLLMGLVSFWLSQPVTTWAEMIKALKSTPWVQTDFGRTSSWFSSSNQVVAMRGSKQTVYSSQDSGARLSYVREDARIYQTSAADKWLPLERDLIAWLADGSNGALHSDVNWTLVSESARTIDDESGQWLELTVKFESDQSPVRTFAAVFLLNPETKLPVSCQVRQGDLALVDANGGSGWQTVSFDYPKDGPANIFDLGVAVGTPIMLAADDSKSGLVRSEGKSAEKIALLNNRSPKPKALLDPKPKSLDPSTEKTVPKISESKPPESEAPALASSEDKSPVKDSAPEASASDLRTPPVLAAAAIPILPIPDTSVAMTSRVDQLVEQVWTEEGIEPADQTTDEAFLRRVYLDVVGRVPTVGEYDQFFELNPEVRRRKLIDQLLDSREHALHMGGIWKRVLVPDDETAISRLGGSGKLERWLSDSFADNQPYDEMVSEILLAEGRVNESGPLLFYAAAKMNAEELAARTSRSFLGMRLECAQCHDHPTEQWSQEDFWSLAAYFAQISRPQGKIEMVSPVLRVHDADFGDVTLPETDIVIKPRLPFRQNQGHGMTKSDVDPISTN